MKHKFLTVPLAAVLALGTCFGLAACGDNGDEHEHTYTVENKCSVCGEEWEYTKSDAFEYTKVVLNGVEGYDVRFGEYEYFEITIVDGVPIVEVQTRGTLFEGEEVVFPYGYNGLPVISIGREHPCTSETVKTITVPKSVFSWGAGVMQAGGESIGSFRCSALEKLNLPDGIPVMTHAQNHNVFEDPSAAYLLGWDTLLTGIGGISGTSGKVCPLYDDPQFRENGALYIGNYLFDTNFEEPVETFTVRDGTKAILVCEGAENVIVPDSVETIAAGAFKIIKSDAKLKSVTLGKGVKEIGELAFAYCESLTSIVIPNGVSEIGEGTFANCTSLTSISIPNSVTKIGEGTFASCTSLTSISIPNSVTKIGDYAFGNCPSLTDIQFAGTKEAWQVIEKGEYWDGETGNYTVTCTNGTVAKETDAT